MRDRIRIAFVEHPHSNRGVAAELLTDCRLDFCHQRVASSLELAKVVADFDPHIVLCTDDMSMDSGDRFLEALRLLCTQTPAILVSTVCELDLAAAGRAGERSDEVKLRRSAGMRGRPTDGTVPRYAQSPALLRRGFSAVLESSAAPAVITNADGWITHANTGACRLLEGMAERSLGSILGEKYDQCPPMPHWLAATGDTGAESCPHRLAYVDSWSILPALVHLDDLIGCATAVERESGAALALIAVDRESGRIPDETCETAKYGSIVRFAPDDFLVVLPYPSAPDRAAITVERVLDSIERNHHRRSQSRLRHPSRSEQLRSELDEALQCHALSVHYQPQFDLKTGRGSGVEALARWVLPSGETIAPSIFIPAAEQAGRIHALDAWMLESACETAYAWCSREAQRTTLSVNVSPRQLDEEFGEVIGRALRKSRFPAGRLELEMAERALMEDPDMVIRRLMQWRELGVRIAIDDFGKDRSSLCYMPRLPVDRLKLDQSLIQNMAQDKKSAAVARLIVSMGADLGVDVIAAGVETEQQLQMLSDLDCPKAQGYLLGRPMPAKQAQLALRRAWGDRATQRTQSSAAAATESFV